MFHTPSHQSAGALPGPGRNSGMIRARFGEHAHAELFVFVIMSATPCSVCGFSYVHFDPPMVDSNAAMRRLDQTIQNVQKAGSNVINKSIEAGKIHSSSWHHYIYVLQSISTTGADKISGEKTLLQSLLPEPDMFASYVVRRTTDIIKEGFGKATATTCLGLFVAAHGGLVTGELVENALVYADMKREKAQVFGYLSSMAAGAVAGSFFGGVGAPLGAVTGVLAYGAKRISYYWNT